LSAYIYIIILIFLSLSVFLGIVARKNSKDSAEDYFLAGRDVKWFHLGLTIFATWFSTFTFLGYPGFYYTRGISWYVTAVIYLLSAPFTAWYIGRKIWLLGKSKGYITPADLLVDFYEIKGFRFFISIICVVALVPYALIQFVGIGKVIDATSSGSISYSTGVILVALATAFYSFFGGTRAIILTDVLQGIIFLAFIALGLIVTFLNTDGLVLGFQKAMEIKPELFILDSSNIGSTLTIAFIWTLGFAVLPHIWQRSYMAKNAESFSKGITLFAFLSFILATVLMTSGILAIPLIEGSPDSDKVISLFYKQYFPLGLPLLVLATFAAGMSTIDSQLISASSVIVRDLINPLLTEKLNTSQEKKIGSFIVVLLIFVLTVLALIPESQGSIILLASKGTAIALMLFIPLFCCLNEISISARASFLTLVIGIFSLFVFEANIIEYSLPYGFGDVFIAFFLQLFFIATYLLIKKLQRSKI